MWVTRLSIVDWVYSKSQIMLVTLKIRNPPRVILCVFGSRTFVSVSWMCKKQTSVSHSSTESENHFFEYWTRNGRFTCFGFMGCGAPKTNPAARNCLRDPEKDRTPTPKQKGNRDVDQLSNVDHFTTNAHSSQGESQSYISEDNEAVIKMIIIDTSPTMIHVSRAHRVTLDWLFDRINLDPKIQLADMLTTGNFTRDEWNHLLRLLNIMNLSMFSCSHFCHCLSDPIRKQCSMSKRVKESNLKEGSAVAELKPMNLNLPSFRKVPSQEVSDPNSPGNQSLDQYGVSARSWEQSAKGGGQSLRKAEARIPKYADLRLKVFKNIKKLVNLVEDAPPLGIQAHKTNILIW